MLRVGDSGDRHWGVENDLCCFSDTCDWLGEDSFGFPSIMILVVCLGSGISFISSVEYPRNPHSFPDDHY